MESGGSAKSCRLSPFPTSLGETTLKRFILVFVLVGTALAEPLHIQQQSQGEVRFVSGGVGVDEVNAMRAMRADFNLSLLFSVQGSGEYVSDVKVQITDQRGQEVLETISEGPMLWAQLKPGRYTVRVDRDGKIVRKTATLGSQQRTSLSFTWPAQKGDQ
jgi:hypothetical protein